MNIISKLSQAARDAGNIAGLTVEVGKLRLKIRRKKDEIVREKIRIGEIMWHKFNSQENVPPEIAEHCEKIRDGCVAIEILENAIDTTKRQFVQCDESCYCCEPCPNCGTYTDCSANYCSSCGSKLDNQCQYDDSEDNCAGDCDCGCNEEK